MFLKNNQSNTRIIVMDGLFLTLYIYPFAYRCYVEKY